MHDNQELKPVTVRQLAIAALVLLIAGSLIIYLVWHHSARLKMPVVSKLIVPGVIKRQMESNPHENESMTFVFPVTR